MLPPTPRRRPLRLAGYDYALPGAYFVTVCLASGTPPLAALDCGRLRTTRFGADVHAAWRALPAHYPHAALDVFVLMPDHVHAVLWLHAAPPQTAAPDCRPDAAPSQDAAHHHGFTPARLLLAAGDRRPGVAPSPAVVHHPQPDVGAGLRPARTGPAPPPVAGLPEIIRAFKSFSARAVNQGRGTPGAPVWQRNYFEHIIRSERALHRVREYVRANPARWAACRQSSP